MSSNASRQMQGMMGAVSQQMKSQGGQGDMMRQMTSRMGGGMMGGGMMGSMPGAGGGVSKKDQRLLTRTDFLLQFVWIPPKAGSLPTDPEELKKKLADEEKKLADAEKAYAGDTSTAKLEETLTAESLKKSQALDTALDKALNGPGGGGAAAGGLPAPAAAGALPAAGQAATKGAGPAQK